jgi:DNA-binding XRE family transcriptional regulator
VTQKTSVHVPAKTTAKPAKRVAAAVRPAAKPAVKPVAKPSLSPRGRGSVAPPVDHDRLLALFAVNMRLLRQHRKLSQEGLADLCDLDRTYISGIERKRRNLGIRNIQRIADALDVDPRELFDPQLHQDPRYLG